MLPKISIVTPSYNQAAYIEQTIESILSQGYQNLEYIIIDGGSRDGSLEIIKKYEKHLAYWISEKDSGQSHAINKGYRHVTGDIFNWINSDDYLQPGCLKTVVEHFDDPEVKILLGRGNIIKENRLIKVSRGTDVYKSNLAKTIGYARIDQPETWHRKQIFDTLVPVSETLQYVMDKDLWIRYLLRYGLSGISFTDAVLINFRLHPESKTSSQQDGFLSESDLLFYRLARQFNWNAEAEFIKDRFHVSDSSQPVQSPGDRHTIQRALHYFLLYKADAFYYRRNLPMAQAAINFVNPDLIEPIDRLLYRRLRFRLSAVMRPVIKLIEKWR